MPKGEKNKPRKEIMSVRVWVEGSVFSCDMKQKAFFTYKKRLRLVRFRRNKRTPAVVSFRSLTMLAAGAAAMSLQRLWDHQELTFEADSARVERRFKLPPPPPQMQAVVTENPPMVPQVVPPKLPKARVPPQRPSVSLPLVASSNITLVALPRRGAIHKHTIRREESLMTLSERRRERERFSTAIAEACVAYRNSPQ